MVLIVRILFPILLIQVHVIYRTLILDINQEYVIEKLTNVIYNRNLKCKLKTNYLAELQNELNVYMPGMTLLN